MSYYDKRVKEHQKEIQALKDRKKLFLAIQKVISDVKVASKERYLYAESVNKNWDEIYFKDSSSCDDGFDDPVWAKPICKVNGKWIHGTERVLIARRDGDDPNWRETDWLKEAIELMGERSVPIIKAEIEKHKEDE